MTPAVTPEVTQALTQAVTPEVTVPCARAGRYGGLGCDTDCRVEESVADSQLWSLRDVSYDAKCEAHHLDIPLTAKSLTDCEVQRQRVSWTILTQTEALRDYSASLSDRRAAR